MTALALRQVAADALAEVGANVVYLRLPKGAPRTTTWLGIEHGFGIRHYATGRNVYIVQTRMAGRLRTVTIGPASVITRHQATIVARRVIAHAQVGLDPATDRKRIRSAPRFDDFFRRVLVALVAALEAVHLRDAMQLSGALPRWRILRRVHRRAERGGRNQVVRRPE